MASAGPATLLERKTNVGVSCEICAIFKNTYCFVEHLRTTAFLILFLGMNPCLPFLKDFVWFFQNIYYQQLKIAYKRRLVICNFPNLLCWFEKSLAYYIDNATIISSKITSMEGWVGLSSLNKRVANLNDFFNL